MLSLVLTARPWLSGRHEIGLCSVWAAVIVVLVLVGPKCHDRHVKVGP